jgi:eukaryotic-like serine/threonine-protein kinase
MIGRTLSHYRILDTLGEGGMGVVYRARDTRLDREVAVKVLRPQALGDPTGRQRFVQEARAVSALNHPHIVTVYDVGQARIDGHDVDFLVMEYLPGRTLAEVLAERRLGLGEALDCAISIVDALAAAHGAGIVHRDVKPANVIVSDAGRVKVLDFGLAKIMGRGPGHAGATAVEGASTTGAVAPETREGALLGTTAYMSPEQAEGKAVDARSDVFSLGAVLYEMVAGRRPFQGGSQGALLAAILRDAAPPLRSLRKNVPRDLERVLSRCLAKDRHQRYTSAGELLLDLATCRARFAARSSGWRAALRRPRYVLPPLAIAVALAASLAWTWKRGAPVRWARDVALPEIDRLVAANDYYQAYWLARQAQPHLPGNAQLERFWKDRCFALSLHTQPPGADVSVRSYGAPAGQWKSIGQTPLERVPVPFETIRLRITREGFEPLDMTAAPGAGRPPGYTYMLDAKGSVPSGMVRVAGGPFEFRNYAPVKLDDYWLDRHEVTNRAYKAFADGGGYRKPEYWKQPFVKDGRVLSWEQAMASFHDATGRPGPSTWQMGTYPEGQGEYPVGGVSWYEAAAYAEFAGKALPTFYHWYQATDLVRSSRFADIIGRSNFSGRGPVAVGSLDGMSPFGSTDMAGNVREWCATASGRERYILGGGWDDPAHAYLGEERLSPWSRVAVNGFRCARYMAPLPGTLAATVAWTWRDYTKEKPASDDAFQSYRSFYAYDRTDLKPAVERVEETEHWRREKVSFAAAYGNQRVPAHLFLPRNSRPPYQTVLFYPSGEAELLKSSDALRMAQFDFIIHSGRAVLHPVYQGTYERRPENTPSGPNEYRDLTVEQVKDFRRALDYLETRSDIDTARLGVLGVSGFFELYVLALDDRLKVGVAYSGGLSAIALPAEVDPINFAPRIRQPILMLNGRYDSWYPLELLQKPLFRLLGTPGKDKRHVLVDSGHAVGRSLDRVRETVDWLDRHLGPVDVSAAR